MIINLYKHRGYIWRTAWADLRTRYAGSGMGVFWNILQPLAMILIFTLIFTRLMPRGDVQEGGLLVPYPVYLCSALLPWMAFAECLNRGTQSFVHNAIYLRKLPIPEQVFVAQTAVSTALGLAISFSLLVAFALILGHSPTWHWLLVPLPMAMFVALAFGIGLALGTVNAFIRDVGQAVPILVQVGFWTYPIVYHEQFLPATVQTALKFNPIYPYMQSIRDLFIRGSLPDAWVWPAMFGWTLAAATFGYLVLRRLRPELRDVL